MASDGVTICGNVASDSSPTSILLSRHENFELLPNNQCASVNVSMRTSLQGRERMPRTCRIRTFRGRNQT
ncbi:hypothetical protein TMatcc_005878 [Talaromyces marneffei ATCC 18224]